MKRFTLVLVTTIAYLQFVSAQENNNAWISGTAGFVSETNDFNDDKLSGGVFGPSFGYNLNDNLSIGLGFEYSSLKFEADDGDEEKINEFKVSPFVRYYKSIGENVSLYGELNVGIGSGKYSVDYSSGTDPDDEEYSIFSVGVAPGIQYWFHDRWSVNAEWGFLEYESFKEKEATFDGDDITTNTFMLGLDFSALSFALNFHF